jgi:NodT family efflux transporter outer membrane factor (OMF) lipoprotein
MKLKNLEMTLPAPVILRRNDFRRRSLNRLLGAALVLGAGCAVGPDYQRPAAAAPAAFKEAEGWESAVPDDAAQRGPWWEVFHDPVLNGLEEQVASSNETLKQAAANYEGARQLVRADRASYFPTLSAAGSGTRSLTPVGSSVVTASPAVPSVQSIPTQTGYRETIYQASLQASWSPDFWGSVRRTVEADTAAAQASAATLAASRLSTQATLAQDYIALRALDEKERLLNHAVEAYRKTLEIVQNKFDAGVSARGDVLSAQTQLDATRAQAVDVGVQRAQYEHAIAVLIGRSPAGLAIAPQAGFHLDVPSVPLQLPSRLLERRPDVAAAERAVAESNARIGIQTAAYYPNITLSAQGGYEGSPIDRLFTAPFRFWTLGTNASDVLLDFGQRRAKVLAARAAQDGDVANYRQTVLVAFQQVEDNLAGLRILGKEAVIEQTAVREAVEASAIAENEYEEGTVDYTTVVTAQEAELTNRVSALTIAQERLTDAVGLIEALGGNWDIGDLPSPSAVSARHSPDGTSVAAAKVSP